MPRQIDPIKINITQLAMQPFKEGKPLDENNMGYKLEPRTPVEFDIVVLDPRPRYFAVRISEKY